MLQHILCWIHGTGYVDITTDGQLFSFLKLLYHGHVTLISSIMKHVVYSNFTDIQWYFWQCQQDAEKWYGILSSEMASNSPGLCPVKDRSTYLVDIVTRGDQQLFFKRILRRRNWNVPLTGSGQTWIYDGVCPYSGKWYRVCNKKKKIEENRYEDVGKCQGQINNPT